MVKRRLLKSIFYRILSIVWIQGITWLLWGDPNTNLIILVSDAVVTTPFYYFYDWIWERLVKNGKEE